MSRWCHPWVRYLSSNVIHNSVGKSESCMNPTVCVHHLLRYIRINNAVDRITNVLFGSHQQTACYQNYHCGLKKEYLITNSILLEFLPCNEA